MEENKKILKNLADTYIAIAQNLYDIHLGKESDESKEYRRKAKVIEEFLSRYEQLEKQIDLDYVEENYIEKSKVIPKLKIKEKIEEYKAKGYIEIAGALQELLEEEQGRCNMK